MRRRWYYWKRRFRADRPALLLFLIFLLAAFLLAENRSEVRGFGKKLYEQYGVRAAQIFLEGWFPGQSGAGTENMRYPVGNELFRYLEESEETEIAGEDPAYRKLLSGRQTAKVREDPKTDENGSRMEREPETAEQGTRGEKPVEKETVAVKPAGSVVIREKLADYDYLMKQFYNVHTTAAADRELIDAGQFLRMDLSLQKSEEEPQILIYHTHSQEAYADYPENPDATVVNVGARLAELLEERGYQVIHDTSVYDLRDGKLDRSSAYTYALDGISGILQKYPSIDVVLDLHRDGVSEGTRLVTEIGGKETAKIMFFNGTSQTPEGPIEYLPNPNRTANLAFSFQMQLLASERYPGFARKIYLKGLRYNLHVRARSALIEVGAQTNTYAEAVNAMEPLADILCRVLEGE